MSLKILLLTFFLIIVPMQAQEEDDLTIILTSGKQTCILESTEANTFVYTDDCLEPGIYTGVKWFSVTLPDDAAWLNLSPVEGDLHPPILDIRGRYFACNFNAQATCQVWVNINDTAYFLQIPPEEDIVVQETAPSQALTQSQQSHLADLQTIATVTSNADETMTAVVQFSESALNATVDTFVPLAGYTADEVSLDITPSGFMITAQNAFMQGTSGTLFFHMIVTIDNNIATLHTDWARFNDIDISSWFMETYDPLINAAVMMQVNAELSQSGTFDYTIDSITLSDTAMELTATLRFR